MWVRVGFYFPLIFYLFVGVISILYDYITCTCNRPYIKTTHTRKCLWPPGFEWNKTFIKLSIFCGSLLYYIGDNLEKVDCNKNASTISLILSAAGLLLYRVLYAALKKLKRYYRNDKGEPPSHNLCSPNRNETQSLVIAYMFLLTIVIDFDVVFTAVLNKIDESTIPCNETVQSDIFWDLFWSMIGIFIQLIITVIFILTQCRHCISRWGRCERICNSLLSKVKLILSTRKPCCLIFIIIWDIFLFFAVLAAVICFLLADNKQVLQCFIRVPKGDERKHRIVFLSISFVVCFFVMLGFLFRKCCCCVQIKGKITKVTIKDGQRLTVRVRNEVGDQRYSFNYNTETKSITSNNCNHAELYRNDIERIIKLPQKISTIKEVGVDNFNNRITVRHHIQEQHYQEVFTINNGRVEIVESDVAEGGGEKQEEEEEKDVAGGGEGGEGKEEEDVAAQENAAEGVQDGEERQAEFGELHSPVPDSRASKLNLPPTVSASELPQDSRTGRPRSRSPSPDIKNDQGDDTEKTSLLHVDTEF